MLFPDHRFFVRDISQVQPSHLTAQLRLLWELIITHLAFPGPDGRSPAPSCLHQHVPSCPFHRGIPALASLPHHPLVPHLNHGHPSLCRQLIVTSKPLNSHGRTSGSQLLPLVSPSDSLHQSLAAPSSKHLLPFLGCPLAMRHSPKPLSCLPFFGSLLEKVLFFFTCTYKLGKSYATEIQRPQLVQNYLLTRAASLPGPVSCFLPYT